MSKTGKVYKIEKKIPLPPAQRRGVMQNSYPFKKMEVGDSFIISEKYSRKQMQLDGNAARAWARAVRNGWRFTVRQTKDNKIRIWRIK